MNRAAEVIGVTRVTVWRWLDSDRGPGAPMDLLMNLIMERGSPLEIALNRLVDRGTSLT